VFLKFMLTYGKGGTRWFPSNNRWVGRGMGVSQARWRWSLSQSVLNLKCNTKSYIFCESQTFPNSSLSQPLGSRNIWSCWFLSNLQVQQWKLGWLSALPTIDQDQPSGWLLPTVSCLNAVVCVYICSALIRLCLRNKPTNSTASPRVSTTCSRNKTRQCVQLATFAGKSSSFLL
jgi:hypothetical protein